MDFVQKISKDLFHLSPVDYVRNTVCTSGGTVAYFPARGNIATAFLDKVYILLLWNLSLHQLSDNTTWHIIQNISWKMFSWRVCLEDNKMGHRPCARNFEVNSAYELDFFALSKNTLTIPSVEQQLNRAKLQNLIILSSNESSRLSEITILLRNRLYFSKISPAQSQTSFFCRL